MKKLETETLQKIIECAEIEKRRAIRRACIITFAATMIVSLFVDCLVLYFLGYF